MDYLRIRLGDEAPQIGCGERQVLVIHCGPKWADVLEPASCVTARLPRHGTPKLRGFDDMARSAVQLPYDPTKMAKRLKRNARLYGRESAKVKDAIATLKDL